MKFTIAKIRWQTEAIVSTTGVADSVLKMSIGAGMKAQTMVGIIIDRKRKSAQMSKPNR